MVACIPVSSFEPDKSLQAGRCTSKRDAGWAKHCGGADEKKFDGKSDVPDRGYFSAGNGGKR
jgi:hypothetical protein